jgi:ligand-binding sensor domain-containing protein
MKSWIKPFSFFGLLTATLLSAVLVAWGSNRTAAADTDPLVTLGEWETFTSATPGFPSSAISAATVDDQSRLWLGSNGGGLGVFDGDTWTLYTNANTGGGLASDDIHSLAAQGTLIFVGTADAGISIYDTALDSWSVVDTGNTPELLSDTIEDIALNGSWWWFATPAGLTRRTLVINTPQWTTFTTANTDLSDDDVLALALDPSGSLWIGTCGGGLDHLSGSAWTNWNTSNSDLPADCVRELEIAQDGAKWMAVSTTGDLHQGLARFDGSGWAQYTPANSGLQDYLVYGLSADRVGRVWVATAGAGLNVIDGAGNWGWYHTGNAGLASNQLQTVLVNEERVWAGTTSAGASVFDPNWRTFNTANSGLAHDFVYTLLLEPGTAWLGTNAGLSRFDGSSFTSYDDIGPLPDNQVLSLLQDDAGSYWVGTAGGIAVFDGVSAWSYHSTADGLPHNQVNALVQDASGRIWAGTLGGAALYDGGWIPFTVSNTPLTSDNVRDMAVDDQGNLWLGTNGGGIGVFSGSKWTLHTASDGLPSDNVVALELDSMGQMWAGTWGGGVAYFDGASWTSFTTAEGLPSDYIQDIAVDGLGRVWVTTDDGGVAGWNGHAWRRLNPRNSGLAHLDVLSAAADSQGGLWLGTQGGGFSLRGPFTAPLGLPAPTFLGFDPASGPAGTTVTLSGTNFDDRDPAFNTVRLGLTELVPRSVTSTTLVVEIPPYASSAPFTVETEGGDATSPQTFIVEAGLNEFEPLGGSAGTLVTFYGSNLHEIDEVLFSQVVTPVTSMETQSASVLAVRVPFGAGSGPITLVDTDTGNTLVTDESFTVTQMQILDAELNQGVAGYELINGKDTLLHVSLGSSSDQFPAHVDLVVLTIADHDGVTLWDDAAFLYDTTISVSEPISATQDGTALFRIPGIVLMDGHNLFHADYTFALSAQIYEGGGVRQVAQQVWTERFRQPSEYSQAVLQPWFYRLLVMEVEDSLSLPGGMDDYLGALDTLSRLLPVADGLSGPSGGLDVVFLPDRLRFSGYQCQPGSTDAWDLGSAFRTYEAFFLMENRRLLYNSFQITHPALFIMAFLHGDCASGSTTGIAAPPPVGSSLVALYDGTTGSTAVQELGHNFGRVPPWAPNRCWPGTGCPGGGGLMDNHSRFQTAAPVGTRAYNIFTAQNITADNPSVMSYASGQTDDNVLFEINDFNCIHNFPSPICSGPAGSQPFPSGLSGYRAATRSPAGTSQDFVLLGQIAEDGSVDVYDSRLQPALGQYSPAYGEAYEIAFLQGSDELAVLPFDPVFGHTHQPPDGLDEAPGLISLRQPFPDGADRVEIRHQGQVLASVDPGSAVPQVTLLYPDGGESFSDDQPVTVQWQASDPDGDPLTYSLAYSADDGASWISITSGISLTQYAWETGWAKGSGQARLRVTASDGIHTATDASDGTFAVAGKAPMVAITGLNDGQTFSQYSFLNLHGLALDLEEGLLEGASLSWASDRDGVLGSGNDLQFHDPSIGTHQISLTARDSQGNTSTAQVSIQVTRDFDRDGLVDSYEDTYASLNFWDPLDANQDGDGDGLINLEEAFWGCHPELADSDADGVADGVEIGAGAACADAGSMPGFPELALGPDTLSFEGMAGGPTTAPLGVEIANAGGGSLQWSASSTVPWLTLDRASGTGTAVVEVIADPGALTIGQYQGEIIFSGAPGTTGGPKAVTVSLTVVPGEHPVFMPLLRRD